MVSRHEIGMKTHSVLKQPIPYDNCGGVPISNFLTIGLTPVSHSVLNVKALVGTLNQERALLCDCEIFANLRITFV